MPALSSNGTGWLITLFTSITFAFIGLVLPNTYKQTQKARPHNKTKLLNEFLGRHQLTYVTYFLALALTASWKYPIMPKLMILAIGLAMASYIVGVYLTVGQDGHFERGHGCIENCRVNIGFFRMLAVVWPNSISTAILLAAAVGITFTVA
jgi:hypothetical protein